MVEVAVISGLLSNLIPPIKDEFSLLWSFRKDVEKLSSTLSSIGAVLEDAERKRKNNRQTEDWLRKLKDVAYECRDIMGECIFEDLRLQVKRQNASSSTQMQVTNCIINPFRNTWIHLKIGHKIKDVQEKLDQISSERSNLHLLENSVDPNTDRLLAASRETISVLSLSDVVYGRDVEKKQIVDILVNTDNVDAKTLSVLPIVGIGGLGKTTFAQIVFNDVKVVKHFDPKIWVYVSQEFDIRLITKAILQDKDSTEATLEELQEKVRTKLRGKRYLIVLDDVWNERIDAWQKLKCILDCGSMGAFILTTTRKRNVAEIMETTVAPFALPYLSDNDCWLLFEERAFRSETSKRSELVEIGKAIAKKCKGVPLVAKALGGQLRRKNDEKEWRQIRDSDIWRISDDQQSILPILWLSYDDLPNDLRRCFAYCAIFPKGVVIRKDRLIQMWMAHGLIPRIENQEVEDVGYTIWNELCWRSFFQDEKWDGIYQTCKMHDLMHELAQSVMKNECYTIDSTSSSNDFGLEIRHITIMVQKLDKTFSVSLKEIEFLQSIILPSTKYGNVSKEILSDLNKLLSLRVFEVCCDVQYLDLHHLGGLKHLKYLNLSGIMVTTLPNSICNLLNLETLNLNECYLLQNLPRDTKDLINLRHLYLEGCHGLKFMPRGMGQLIHLKTLSLFVISNEKYHCQLEDLKELNIRGSLKIKNLERVSNRCIAKRRINFAAKMSSINSLDLQWEDNSDDNEILKNRHVEIGESMEVPVTKLKILRFRGYKGVNLPKWVAKSSPTLTCLVLMGLSNVDHILTIDMDENGLVEFFPLLKELRICDMENLKELVYSSCTKSAFPTVSIIEIINCPNLSNLPQHLKSVKHITIGGECSNALLYSISNLSGLTRLYLYGLKEISVLFPAANDVDKITAQGEQSTFQSLQHIEIHNCPNLICLLDEGMKMEFPSLQILKVYSCNRLGEGGGRATRGVTDLNSLKKLHIKSCPELMIRMEDINTKSLQHLSIRNCPKLVSSEEVDDFIVLLNSLQERLGCENFDVDMLFGNR